MVTRTQTDPRTLPARAAPFSALSVEAAIPLFLDGYFSTCRRSAKTLAAYRLDLAQFVPPNRKAPLAAVTPESIERWASSLRTEGYAPASIRRKLASLTVFFNYWVRRRVIERSPLWNLRLDVGKSRTLTRVLGAFELSNLLSQVQREAASATLVSLRNRAIVELMFATGLRVGEVAALSVSDLLPDQRALLVKGKGDRQRLAFLIDDGSYSCVENYLRIRGTGNNTCPSLFINARRGPLSTQGIANVVSAVSERAGIRRRITPHMLRHTVATMLLENGADIRIVQEFLGHASITTTQRYTHVAKEHLLARLRLTHPNLTGLPKPSTT